MVSFYSVVTLATAVSAASLVHRDVATVLANLEAINNQTEALTAAIVAWDASLLGALGIQSDVSSLEVGIHGNISTISQTDKSSQTAITDATTEAETEAVADSADSLTILTCKPV